MRSKKLGTPLAVVIEYMKKKQTHPILNWPNTLVLTIGLLPFNAFAQGDKCEAFFANSGFFNPPPIVPKQDNWAELYKKSHLSPNREVWLRIKQALQKNVTHLEHPLEKAGQSSDQIGKVYTRLAQELPVLKELLHLTTQTEKGYTLKHKDFISLKVRVTNQLIAISKKPKSALEVFAALESLKLLSSLETQVEFPKTPQNPQSEKTAQDEVNPKTNKDSEQEQKQNKENAESDQSEQEASWNKPQDRYNPENKDLANEGKSGKQKNVDMVLTDVNVHKQLMRQKIYDQFNLNTWSSVPTLREQAQAEKAFSKKLIVNPLNESLVDVPLPYGYTLIAGNYADHKVIEVGVGEFKVAVQSNKAVTLGLSRIQSENIMPSPPRNSNNQELNFWPQHLLLFTQSLKNLSPLEAAARLEKYLSEDGGFLYYSKGDKIDASELSQIDVKYQQLLTQMPKPMAMAHAGVFNCDGASWIGALLLRDVLNIPVRIAGGRTSAGTKMVANEKLHVVKSADPAHAWVEVFADKRWVPFDMTPKNNIPKTESAPSDVERENTNSGDTKPPQAEEKTQKQNSPDAAKNEADKAKQQPKQADAKTEQEKSDSSKVKGASDQDKKKPEEEQKEHDSAEDVEITKKIQDLLKAKSTARQLGDEKLDLVQRLLRKTELSFLENLIQDGQAMRHQIDHKTLLDALAENIRWKNTVERSRDKVSQYLMAAKFDKYEGIANAMAQVRLLISQNKLIEARSQLLLVKGLFLSLGEYRNLNQKEAKAIRNLEVILARLEEVKHENSKEYTLVQDLTKTLPGSISKAWLQRQYGSDYEKLGSSNNLRLAQDLTSGKLRPLLQMAAVSDFVDMTLNSTPEPNWKEEVTLNRSLVPKPRRDLVITRNPLDFARMLLSPKPGEHLFAPTIQGRQYAIGSLETRRTPDPIKRIERKVTVVYYDVSPSMNGEPIQAQDALLMAFVDRALSEVDAIGRPAHEIYLIPFNDNILDGVHIASREAAESFLSRRMNLTTATSGNTDIQKVIENFYDIVASSYKSKAAQGRDKLFQRANMVLFSDGESNIDKDQLEAKRQSMPGNLQINMNFVSLGDAVNETLKDLSENQNLASAKPSFRSLNKAQLKAISEVSVDYNPDAFASNQRLHGNKLFEINELLKTILPEEREPTSPRLIQRALHQLQITKTPASQISNIEMAYLMSQLASKLSSVQIDAEFKRQIVENLVASYPQVATRSWQQMTHPEKEAFEKLQSWIQNK